jgi:hypothetical protein
MSRIRSVWLWKTLGFFFICFMLYQPSFAADEGETIRHTASPDGLVEQWDIICPNVKVPLVPYPNIKFHKGDKITIKAGGCVQTGSGRMKYVNPIGPNSDKLHFGQIMIMGVTNGLERISFYVDKPARQATMDGFLHLGYTDNRYDDNGYYNEDNGVQNQCMGEYAAYVKIKIDRVPTGPGSPAGLCVSPNLKFVSPANGMSSRCEYPTCPPLILKWAYQNLPQPQFKTVKITVTDFHTGKPQVFPNISLGKNGNGEFILNNLRPHGDTHYAVKIESEQSPTVCNVVNFNLSYSTSPGMVPMQGKTCTADDIKYNRNGCGEKSTGAMMPMTR